MQAYCGDDGVIGRSHVLQFVTVLEYGVHKEYEISPLEGHTCVRECLTAHLRPQAAELETAIAAVRVNRGVGREIFVSYRSPKI